MNRFSKFLLGSVTTLALAIGLIASAAPSHAQTYYCHWTPRGTVCNQ